MNNMKIVPEIPNMSNVGLISIKYVWRKNGVEFSEIKTSPPYDLEMPMYEYEMIDPVRVIYTLSNGVFDDYVYPNLTHPKEFESGLSHPGTMISYPKVKMLDMGGSVRIRARNVEYVGESGNIPYLKLYDSKNVIILENKNQLYAKEIKSTELYLAKVYNDYNYGGHGYNSEPAVYPLVRAKEDVTNDVIITHTTIVSPTDNICEFKHHQFLIDVENVRVTVNGTLVPIVYNIDEDTIRVTLPNGLTVDDIIVVIFEVEMYYEGTRETREVNKPIYIGE